CCSLGETVILAMTVPVSPASSVTVREMVKFPAVKYVCWVMLPNPLVLSPKLHAYETMKPSGSRLWLASKDTVAPCCGFDGKNVNCTRGGMSGGLAVTVMVWVATEDRPPLSVIVRTMV